jgi:asparagine synthetase B (glutamine-hydrolysing)
MPGIIGLIRIDGKPLRNGLFEEMLTDLQRSQNAGEDRWIAPDRCAAAARLHKGIFNPASQPVQSSDNACLLFMDGEVYNDEFDPDDQARGVLNAYLQEGETLFPRLNGSFALLIIEPNKKELTLVVDRMATVPIYYTHRGQLFAFSAEIKPLLRIFESDRRVDSEAVENFLSSGFLLEGRTLIEGIRSLCPGEILEVKAGGVKRKRYWKFHFAEDRDRFNQRELEDELLRVCKQAVRRQIRGDYTFAVPLSGGYDSRSLLFLWKSVNTGRKLRTVTWGVNEDEPGSDAWVARRLSSFLDTEHQFFHLKAECLPDHFQEFIRRDEGRTDAVGNYPEGLRVFERIRNTTGVQVLLRGNEIFGARNRVFREKDTLHTAFIDSFSIYPNSFHYLKPKVYRFLKDIGEDRMRRLYTSAPYEDPVDWKDYLFINLRVSGYQSPR